MNRSLWIAVWGLAVAGFASRPAEAQCPTSGWGGWGAPFSVGAYGSNPYGLGMVPVPPYFALHPPVYYSLPVARPYGFSPYALPPGVAPIEPSIVEVAPKEIINPHVEPLPEKKTAAPATVAKWIVNPFYAPETPRIAQRAE